MQHDFRTRSIGRHLRSPFPTCGLPHATYRPPMSTKLYLYIYNYNLLVTLELYKYAAPKTSKVKVFSLSRTRAKRRFLYIHRRAQQARGGRRFSRLLVSSHIHLHTPPYSTNLLLYIHIILFLSRALGTSPAYQRHCQYLPANTKKKKKYLSSTHTHFRRKKT